MGELADVSPLTPVYSQLLPKKNICALTPANFNLLPITPDKNICPLTPANSNLLPITPVKKLLLSNKHMDGTARQRPVLANLVL